MHAKLVALAQANYADSKCVCAEIKLLPTTFQLECADGRLMVTSFLTHDLAFSISDSLLPRPERTGGDSLYCRESAINL
jgi:hypothetical protein